VKRLKVKRLKYRSRFECGLFNGSYQLEFLAYIKQLEKHIKYNINIFYMKEEMINNTFTYQADMIITFAMFYMIILSNNIRGIFTCRQTTFFEKNKPLVYLTSFVLFYFLASLVSNTQGLRYVPPIHKLLYTFVYFLIFLITTRLDFKITFVVLALIFFIYFIELNKNFYLNHKDSENNDLEPSKLQKEYSKHWITLDYPFKIRLFHVKSNHFVLIDKLEKMLYVLIYILVILGLIAYGGEIKDTLKNKKDLSWFDVFADTDICNLQDRRPLYHYIKLGLGLKI
jgi:hypothetical protein